MTTDHLRSSGTRSCGCGNDPEGVGKQTLRERLDLTGHRFGMLTALRPAENIGKQTSWVCRCNCGKETVVKTRDLRGGLAQSCGCQRTEEQQRRMAVTCEGKQSRRLDLTGQRYGKLTVLRPAENIDNQTAWVCRCDCGQETVVKTFKLRAGKATSCGCEYKEEASLEPTFVCEQTSRKRLDLTGQRFGKLTVLRPAENIGYQTAWLCRCDCGQETVVKTCNLRNGKAKSCGCQGVHRPDLTGQRFGKLTVLRPSMDAEGKMAWVCRCDCGKETTERTGDLRDGITKSCGCLIHNGKDPMDLTCVSEQTARKRLDLTDQRFGKLTVLRPAENIGKHTAWICRCDCGRETIVRTGNLRSGNTTSCGCLGIHGEERISRKRLDLTGQRFGKLTALRPAENIGGDTAWVCRCDCGRETIVRTGNLRSGGRKTCCCLHHNVRDPLEPTFTHEQTSKKRLDLTGRRFGKLTVLRPAEDIGRQTAWVCRCDCGRETIAKTVNLRNGHTKNCGRQYGPCAETIQGKTARKDNTSGVPGVEWVARDQRWKATITFRRERHYLGTYVRFADAVEARKQAETDLYDRTIHEFAEARGKGSGG